ncbi:Cna B-type domain-containing protein [Lapidilactobacillus achengensis]|uniref:Cna B-type domain-containing protein n=1 Tax=Lapidilactobacillus achengensis TaxID=2486000 RepID=A0ABW1ULR4_9LACO|nr:Cna B-type domain-containing protein [Lapidilactobacillus achengensis]
MKKIVRNLLLAGLLLVGVASGAQVQRAAAATTIGAFGYDQNNGTTLNDGEADLDHSGADTWNYNGGDAEHFTAYNRDGVTVQPAASVKKSVKETSTQGLFDVSLAIRGNSQVVNTPVDIAIVMDYSSTMKGDKQATAIAGVNDFIDGLAPYFAKGEVRLAIVSYNREVQSTGFHTGTGAKAAIDAFLKAPGLTATSGTFMQAGLLRGQQLLQDDRAAGNARTCVLIHVGDGKANRAYTMNERGATVPGVNIVASSAYPDTPLANYPTGTILPLIASYISSGESKSPKELIEGTTPEIVQNTMGTILDVRDHSGFETYSIGVQPEKQGDYLDRNIAAKPDRYREIDENLSDLSEALDSISAQIDDTIPNGTVVDPMGSGLLLASDFSQPNGSWSLTGQVKNASGNWVAESNQLLTDSVAVSAANGQIKMTGIELGANEQLTLTYQVRIDTETNDFKPETWLLTNGRTTLDPTSEGQEQFDFPIPSVKAPGVKLSLIKLWQDQNNHLGQRPDQVQVHLTRGVTTAQTAWTTSAPLTLTAADQWQKTISQVSLTDGTDVYLPKFNNHGEDFVYSMTEATKLPDYQTSVQTKGNTITLTNTQAAKDKDKDKDDHDTDDDQELTSDGKRPGQAGKLPQAGESQMPANLLVSGVLLLALVIWGIVSLIRHKRK